mmetsp:Transcript_2175/g.4486  ORF Transcript_2175/g.4486 Transcript_2175/m.4486 type:complete len:270 (-) Transcript_2175:371-1180(-)
MARIPEVSATTERRVFIVGEIRANGKDEGGVFLDLVNKGILERERVEEKLEENIIDRTDYYFVNREVPVALAIKVRGKKFNELEAKWSATEDQQSGKFDAFQKVRVKCSGEESGAIKNVCNAVTRPLSVNLQKKHVDLAMRAVQRCLKLVIDVEITSKKSYDLGVVAVKKSGCRMKLQKGSPGPRIEEVLLSTFACLIHVSEISEGVPLKLNSHPSFCGRTLNIEKLEGNIDDAEKLYQEILSCPSVLHGTLLSQSFGDYTRSCIEQLM